MAPPKTSYVDDDGYEVEYGRNMKSRGDPVDLDEIFDNDYRDDESLEGDSEESEGSYEDLLETRRFFDNPNKRLFDSDASQIPGSPFSKPGLRFSNRPTEPLNLARYASALAFLLTIGWVGFLFFDAIWQYNKPSRILVEIFLAILSFFGIFWNTYFIIGSIAKCFIPSKAFKTNTKFCSIIPETKPEEAAWLDVTIQIPVYKESLQEVLMPTVKSCIKAREYYSSHSKARCNIVICDDGMMNLLKDNFAVAEMLWENIVQTQGMVFKLSKLLKRVPTASRRHLKGLRSKSVYEVFHRMLFYYHYDIGFVARSTIDRRGKFKKASNLNSHLRLALGAAQFQESQGDISYSDALMHESHNDNGSRFIMFGNDVKIGHLIVINDSDARMSESVILKTVPEFLNDSSLGFTQHATKTMVDQRGESYYINMLTAYTDALYQGHFLLSSIIGCHPPLVGHSIFLRTEALRQVGRVRTLRKANQWLRNIGLRFLPVDQIGFGNLHAENRIDYWSEEHCSEDFEVMIHFYNLGFNGRYCAYPDCEFEEGITRTFDEEAGRHRKFALGAHELLLHPFSDWLGRGIFTPLFKTFMSCDIPAYYKVYLTAYLCSYTSGGTYIIVFTLAAIVRLIDTSEIASLWTFSPAGVIVLNIIAFYVIGYTTFLIALCRMYWNNNKLFFPEYRKSIGGMLYMVFIKIRYCLTFQFLFYTVASITFYFLGSMDHLLSKSTVVSATNKDSITQSRCIAFWEMAKFNIGSWMIAAVMAGLAYITVLQDADWDVTKMPGHLLYHALFAGPAFFFAFMAFVVPIILNPYILGWPFICEKKKPHPKPETPRKVKRDALGRVVDIKTFMDTAKQLDSEIARAQTKPDVELGSLGTKDLFSKAGSSPDMSPKRLDKAQLGRDASDPSVQSLRQQLRDRHQMPSITELDNETRRSSSRPNSRPSSRSNSLERHSNGSRPRASKGENGSRPMQERTSYARRPSYEKEKESRQKSSDKRSGMSWEV